MSGERAEKSPSLSHYCKDATKRSGLFLLIELSSGAATSRERQHGGSMRLSPNHL
eukprot:COSAG03_NODE_23823_length_277_cov_0.286517_1_plen_54_part_10